VNSDGYRAGAVAVVGRPNVGKSSLVNHVVGQKVSIVSDKPQTTRKRILGIATTPRWQIVFADTPGLHEARHKLGAALNEAARQTLDECDVVLVMVDVSKRPGKEDRALAEQLALAGSKRPLVLGMNKMDLLKPVDVEANYEAYLALFPTERSMMTSLTQGHNVDLLVSLLVDALPEGPPLYPEEEVTDQPMRELASELVREKALRLTRQEVPHALATTTEAWEEEDGLTRISVVLLVETEGQKAILIGKKGAMLKRIGTEARLEMEEMIGGRVFLELFVKVRPDWRQNPRWLRELGMV
jgi:GTP-binding protein Era